MPLRKVLELIKCREIEPNDLIKDVFKCRNAMCNLWPVPGNPVRILSEVLDDIDRFILASKVYMPDNRLRALTRLDKLIKGEVDQMAAQLEIEHFWAGALRRAVVDGDVETGSVMAGQSVGMVTSVQSCAEIIAELVEQAVVALAQR